MLLEEAWTVTKIVELSAKQITFGVEKKVLLTVGRAAAMVSLSRCGGQGQKAGPIQINKHPAFGPRHVTSLNPVAIIHALRNLRHLSYSRIMFYLQITFITALAFLPQWASAQFGFFDQMFHGQGHQYQQQQQHQRPGGSQWSNMADAGKKASISQSTLCQRTT